MFRVVALATAIGVSLALGVAGAQAADLGSPVAPSPVQPLSPVPYNWNGFYAGINAGYGFGRSHWNDPAFGSNSGGFDVGGALVGGQIGYNWQFGPWVLGLETDADWTNINGSTTGIGAICGVDGGGQCKTQQNWFGTTRARAGYAFGAVMPYVTGGVAYGDRSVNVPTGTSNSVNAGWAAGGGVEVGLNRNWSAKAEYLHLDLGTANFFSAATGSNSLKVPLTDDLVRAGVNYHW